MHLSSLSGLGNRNLNATLTGAPFHLNLLEWYLTRIPKETIIKPNIFLFNEVVDAGNAGYRRGYHPTPIK